MFENIENLKIISSLHRTSASHNKIENRPTNTFIMRISGKVEYDFYDKIITLNKGEIIFLPKGISYKSRCLPGEECIYTSINFEGQLTDPKVAVFSMENFYEADYICNHFSDLWNFGNAADKHKCYALFYDLLSYLSNTERLKHENEKKHTIIDPALDYLKKHIFDPMLNVEKLHNLCGISDTYFRKIFISRFGTSPQKYIAISRITHAKTVIDSGDFDTIKEVALSVGFSDPLYFGKVFKKFYGTSPLNIVKGLL